MSRRPVDNGNGRVTAMTLLTGMRPRSVPYQQLVFLLVRKIPIVTKVLRDLATVHVAWWSIIRRIPNNGSPQEPERLNSPYMLFESNFDGEWEPYIDTFGLMIPFEVDMVWWRCWGYPGARPTGGAIGYVDRHQFPVEHYYAAYPDASAKTVLSALKLRERFDAFQAEGVDLDDERWMAAYDRFVRASQRDL